ncbi:thiol reductant ABC exporter subunit CydC [Aliidiomarina sedimenti]|uniref:Thiol reductant ABC exporter subunit CydC n=1 Tax=Aliidiomarina sedimenti TaxID=1933879 RepID=A0ABY0BYC6_9GAMM|nr:thiol reductant ABC exporter subunit CydC [Aliidiomarina sedimenti]RUO29377.1 thiol reductant ABC exporter subunit CydC [Aliidiomarina sedimenti]
MWQRTDWQRLKPWLGVWHQQRGRLFIGIMLMLVTAWAGIALLGLSAWFISAAGLFVVAFDIFLPGAGIRALALIRTVARYFERVRNHDLVLNWQNRWRVRLFKGLMTLSVTSTERFRAARLLQRLTQDLSALDDLYLRILGPLLVASISAVVLGAAFWLLHPALAAVIWICSLVLLLLLTTVFAQRLRRLAAKELGDSEYLRQQAVDFVQCKAELHAWGVLAPAVREVAQARLQLGQTQHQLRRRLSWLQLALEGFGHGLLIVMLGLAMWLSFEGAFSTPLALFAAFAVLASIDVWQPLAQAMLLWGRVQGASERLQGYLRRALELPSVQPSTDESKPQQAPSIKVSQAIIENRPLTAKSLSMTVAQQQLILLKGHSGCGKTSLLQAIAGLLPLQQGEIEFHHQGQPIARPSFTLLTQYTHIYSATVASNLRMARSGVTDEMLWQALEIVELADDIEGLPEQLDTWLGDGGVQLSGGQSRRLALARCLLHPAPLMLLDEPFSGVGVAQSERIWRSIQPLLKGKTVICVTHQVLPVVEPEGSDNTADPIVQQDFELCYDR